MIVFWLSALALIVVTLAILLSPLLRIRRGTAGGGHAVEVYHSRIAALEEEHRVGALADADLDQARAELARELLADSGAAAGDDGAPAGRPATSSRGRGSGPWLAIAVGVGVPLLAIALYQRLGEPGALDPRVVAGPAPAASPAGDGVAPEVEVMVARLAERLRAEPGNSEGWLLLGRSYMALERYGEAADAYAAAHDLLGDSAGVLTNLAEAEALRDGQNFLGMQGERLETALRLDPAYPKALWLGAFAAMQRGDEALAVHRWQSLLDRQPADSEAAGILRGLIANAGAGAAPPGLGAATDKAPPPPEQAGLTVNVSVADALVTGLDGTETLFIFARSVDGPPMPLAAVRRRVGELPLTVTLDDSMAMGPGGRLSDAERVIVGARISSTGTATPGSGDLQGFSAPVAAADGGTVSVVISEKIP
jgi:cytochrome c-type biogenesis protein CcmH